MDGSLLRNALLALVAASSPSRRRPRQTSMTTTLAGSLSSPCVQPAKGPMHFMPNWDSRGAAPSQIVYKGSYVFFVEPDA
jgi:hypothetical protein